MYWSRFWRWYDFVWVLVCVSTLDSNELVWQLRGILHCFVCSLRGVIALEPRVSSLKFVPSRCDCALEPRVLRIEFGEIELEGIISLLDLTWIWSAVLGEL